VALPIKNYKQHNVLSSCTTTEHNKSKIQLACDFRVVSNGTKSIPNFIQIRPALLELNHADRQTEKQPISCSLLTLGREEHLIIRIYTTLLSLSTALKLIFTFLDIKIGWKVSMPLLMVDMWYLCYVHVIGMGQRAVVMQDYQYYLSLVYKIASNILLSWLTP
jgi:hypothetical protein